MRNSDSGKLVLVATPIGNLGDMSHRAETTLGEADIVMAEDTRRTAKFVKDKKKLYSYHEHNSTGRLPQIKEFLEERLTVAMVSDAGMPGISDPAFRAVRIAIQNGFEVLVIPGACAVVTALAGSGLPVDRFCFEGFLPRKSGARQKKMESISEYPGTVIYFIGPHHLVKYIEDMIAVFGDRPACVARELTKIHEEYTRGRLSEILEDYQSRKIKGEITLCVAGSGVESNYFD